MERFIRWLEDLLAKVFAPEDMPKTESGTTEAKVVAAAAGAGAGLLLVGALRYLIRTLPLPQSVKDMLLALITMLPVASSLVVGYAAPHTPRVPVPLKR